MKEREAPWEGGHRGTGEEIEVVSFKLSPSFWDTSVCGILIQTDI